MKRIIKKAAMTATVIIGLAGTLALPVGAQVVGFGGGVTITGTTNTTAMDTNTLAAYIRKTQLQVTSPGANVETGFVGNVYLTLNPNSITNALLVGSWSGSGFTGTTNVTLSAYYTNTPVYTVLQAQNGTNQPQVLLLYGP